MVSSCGGPAMKWTVPLTTSHVLQLLRAEPDVQKALLIFESAAGEHSSGYRHDHSTFSFMSTRLAAAGLPRSAEILLSRALSELGDPPAEPSFLPIIRSYSRARLPLDALRLFRSMTSQFLLPPSHRSYNAVLSVLVASRHLSLAKTLFSEMKPRGIPFTAATYNILIKALCYSSGALETAVRIFRQMPERDACTYNTLIHGLCRHGRAHDARKMFDEMLHQGCTPTVVTFTSLMDGLCRTGLFENALQLFDDMRERGIKPNAVTYTSLIDGLCRGGRWAEAMGFLETMGREGCSPNVITYSALIDGLCGQGRLGEAMEVFDRMRIQGRKPDAGLYCKIIKILCESKRYQEAANYLDEMAWCGVVPNRLTWGLHVRWHNTVIRGLCGTRGVTIRIFQTYRSARSRGISVEPETYGALVDCCCREGDADKAMSIVDGMVVDGCFPDSNVWCSILAVLWEGRKVREAAELIWDELLCGDADHDVSQGL